MRFAVQIFRFFASLPLAIFLLLALALVFAAGTFIESSYGTDAAALLVYRSPWMVLLLILLVLNLAAAALDRLPWKKKHVGFVTTHAGIILILAGSLLTRAYGREGQMALAEGEATNRIILNEPLLQISSLDKGGVSFFSVPRQAFPWQGRDALMADGVHPPDFPRVTLLRYFPRASRKEEIRESQDGPAALQVTLESSFMNVTHWLVLGDAEKERILLGPAELQFTRDALNPPKKGESRGILDFQFENKKIEIPIPEDTAKNIPLEGTPYRVTVLRILKEAVVEQGKLRDQSGAWNNPAVELLLEGEGIRERHTVFSNVPDFPTMHGMKPSAAGVRIYYRRSGEAGGPKNELRFVWREDGLPRYQIRKGETVTEGILQLGERYTTGWMDFEFRVEKYYSHAEIDTLYAAEPVSSLSEEHLSAAEVELEWKGERKSAWLGQGDRRTLAWKGDSFQLVYGLRTLPVGFGIKLRDFRMTHDPGTIRPASFESDVTLMDNSTGLRRDTTIWMNQPLKYRGFKVFQSGYQQPAGAPEVSIFAVAKDPGIPVKYTGALVLIAGILLMFYSTKFSSRNKEEAREEALIQ